MAAGEGSAMAELAAPPEVQQEESITVVVADDSFLVREAISRLLAEEPDVEVAAVCADGPALLAAVARERPAVVVADVRLGLDRDGPPGGAVAELRRRHPELGLVVLSQHDEPHLGAELLARGAVGRSCLLMDLVRDRRQLTAAIDAAAHGRALVDGRVVDRMLEYRARAADSPLAELSPREREILAEIATGKSNARIAADLVLTKRAVEKHINAIFMKLGLSWEPDVSRRVKATLIHLEATGEHRAR